MLSFFKKLFGAKTTQTPETPAPYKLEPAQCGCGRSPTGLCVGLHKLTEEEWATNDANPNKTTPKKTAKAPAAKKAPAKPRTRKPKVQQIG